MHIGILAYDYNNNSNNDTGKAVSALTSKIWG
jgi:hypothetical protein